MKILLAVLSAVVLSMPIALPAFAGSLTVTDVKDLAGTWEGQGRSTYGSSSIPTIWTVREDGTYTSTGGPSNTEGKIQLANGKLSYESGLSSGTLTLEEHKGKQILSGSGTGKRSGQPFSFEFVRK